MSLIFMDGLDGYTTDTELLTKWDYINPTEVNFHATNGRFGGGCLVGSGANHNLGAGKMFLDRVTGTTATTDEFRMGFSFYTPDDVGGDDVYIVNLISSNGFFNMRLELSCFDLSLRASRSPEYLWNIGGTELGNSAADAVVIGTWHWIELRVVIHDSAGIFQVKVDDTLVIDITGADTHDASAAADVAGFYFGTNKEALNLWRYDDVVVWDSSGSAPTGWIGDSRIDTLRPNGAGDSSGSTPSAGTRHGAVDEAGLNDGNITYVDLSTAADKDLYNIDDFGLDPATIHAVTVNIAAIATSTEPREFRAKVKSGTTEGDGTTVWAGNQPEYHLHQEFFLTNPDTALAWTGAEIDDMQVGQEVVS